MYGDGPEPDGQLMKLMAEWEVMWKPLFFQVNKEYIFGKTNKDSKVKKGILKKS
jgi:hypothetical protein